MGSRWGLLATFPSSRKLTLDEVAAVVVRLDDLEMPDAAFHVEPWMTQRGLHVLVVMDLEPTDDEKAAVANLVLASLPPGTLGTPHWRVDAPELPATTVEQ